MIGVQPRHLREAVVAICPDIHARINDVEKHERTDQQLWRELSCCLLSSQVPFPLAQAAADEIYRVGALEMQVGRRWEEVQTVVLTILQSRFDVGPSSRRYRFPVSRSYQLAKTWALVRERSGSLSAALASFEDAHEARSWFVTNAPGIGPKQASMFLRNVGVTYDLAILDRHVLKYMSALGLCSVQVSQLSSLGQYRVHEAVLQEHAADVGYPVGLVDWAIWIVMRVARLDANDRSVPP
jgi:N-glycosylase/DNA lyase